MKKLEARGLGFSRHPDSLRWETMIADISSLDCCSETAPRKARDRTLPPPAPVDDDAQATSDRHQAGLASEYHQFALAFRQFDSLLPKIETLSTDLQ